MYAIYAQISYNLGENIYLYTTFYSFVCMRYLHIIYIYISDGRAK